MPELPEVENVRRTLSGHLAGRRIVRVRSGRVDVVRGPSGGAALLAGQAVAELARHGKQLALVGDGGGCVCVHLGMSGSLQFHPAGVERAEARHEHVTWTFEEGSRLVFRDPRRFGGLWTFPSRVELEMRRWSALGPDALAVRPGELLVRLSRTRRALKAALLDQHLVAGLGNIYVDETLHAARLSPLMPANRLALPGCQRLVGQMRRILRRSIRWGGSTLRDYADGDGRSGWFQTRLRVYGRAGEPCRSCREPIRAEVVAGRTTAYCLQCQPIVA